VHHHPRRFVDGRQVVILEQHVERDRLWHRRVLHLERGHLDADQIATFDAVRGLGRAPADCHLPVADQRLDLDARELVEPRRQDLVEPLPGRVRGEFNVIVLFAHARLTRSVATARASR